MAAHQSSLSQLSDARNQLDETMSQVAKLEVVPASLALIFTVVFMLGTSEQSEEPEQGVDDGLE